MIFKNRQSNLPFSIPVMPMLVIATGLVIVFYGVLSVSPPSSQWLSFQWLKRYCFAHPTAALNLWLFGLLLVVLARKALDVIAQQTHSNNAIERLVRLLIEEPQASKSDLLPWLVAAWKTQPLAILQSWFGERVTHLLSMQVQRGHTRGLVRDIDFLASQVAKSQRDSYGLIRLATIAMPILGLLGTILVMSTLFHPYEVHALASGTQETASLATSSFDASKLFAAFDSLSLALVLTILSMFLQYGVARSELSLLDRIDIALREQLVERFQEEEEVQTANSDPMVQRLVDQLGSVMLGVVDKQASLWRGTIEEAHSFWMQSTAAATIEAERALAKAIDESISRYAMHLEKSAALGAAQIESRWQQWQTTLSEQARLMHHQQAEITRQTELLVQLVDKCGDLHQMERALDHSLHRLTDIDRFHDAAICLTEGIAFIATQMERHGNLGKNAARAESPPDTIAMPKSNEMRRRAA